MTQFAHLFSLPRTKQYRNHCWLEEKGGWGAPLLLCVFNLLFWLLPWTLLKEGFDLLFIFAIAADCKLQDQGTYQNLWVSVCLKAKDKPPWFPWTTNLSIVCHISTVKLLPEVSCSYSTFKLDFDLLLFSFPWPPFPSCPIWRVSHLSGTKLCQYSGAWVNVTK